MRNILKKSLAFCLVAALCLTAMIGAINVSAATYNATITVADQTVEPGTTSVPVVLAIDVADSGINEALIKVSSDLGTIDAEATIVKADGTDYSPEELEALNYVIGYDEGAAYSDFWLSAKTSDVAVDEAYIKVVFTVDAAKDLGDYDIVIDIPEDTVIAASPAEDVINFVYEPGTVTIAAAPAGPTLDSSLQVGRQIFISEVIGLYYGLPVTQYRDAGYDNYYIEVVATKYDENFNIITAEPVILDDDDYVDTVSGAERFKYDGTAGYEMLLNISATVYCEKDGVVTCSPTKNDTLAARTLVGLNQELAKAEADRDADLLALYLDMVNYGAAAEDYFANKSTTDPNSDLAKSTARANDAFAEYQGYATQTARTPENINATTRAEGVAKTTAIGKQCVVMASNVLAYELVPGTYDSSKVYLEVSYENSLFGRTENGGATYAETQLVDGRVYRFNKIALYDLNQPVTAKLYVEGTAEPLVTNVYSIESAAAQNTDATADAIFEAIMKIGYSARAYFDLEV